MQPGVAADHFRRRAAEPSCEGLVDEQEAPARIDRVKADRRVVEKIDELVALVADHRLHFLAGGDVLEIPEAIARPSGDRVDRDVEPPGGGAA